MFHYEFVTMNFSVNNFNPEILLAMGSIVLAILMSRSGVRVNPWWERPVARLALHPRLAVLVAALFPVILRCLLLPLFPIPEPRVHDEFSFLLGASTLLEGRLANPTHPLWVHFESIHILNRPTYASVFPMAQAAALGIGMALGHAWIGVLLSIGLLCGSVCWMLQGWLPGRWALLGALLLGIQLGISSYWMNSYWGGAMAGAGGALLLGALPRLQRRPHIRYAFVMAAGFAILANSRAFEGAVYSLGIVFALLEWMVKKGRPMFALTMRKVVLPLAMLSAVLAAGMGFYFAKITGSAFTAPYVMYRTSQTMAPHFLWQTPRPEPLYNNREMRHFYAVEEMTHYSNAHNEVLKDAFDKISAYWRFYLGPLLTIPLLCLPAVWRRKSTLPLFWMGAFFGLALAGQVWHNRHYAAPGLGLLLLIVMLSMRQLGTWRWRGLGVGRRLVHMLPIACVAMLLIKIVIASATPAGSVVESGWQWPQATGLERAGIVRFLSESQGKHLVLVRYGQRHDTGDEWVYNSANIDGSQVVWARELDRASNRKLLAYFSGRKVWLVEPDEPSPKLISYESAARKPMPFITPGAPGIESLRSVDDVQRNVQVAAGGAVRLGCDYWNYYFEQATGVAGPDVAHGCYQGRDRSQQISFSKYFEWLMQQH